MKKIIYSLIIATVFLHDRAHAQDSTLFPRGEIGKNTNNYTGTIWLNELNHPDSTFNFSIAQAIYAPHSKLDWHIHPGGQYLLITEGIGYYQEKGKTGQVVQKGDVIKCLPGVAHWHGAAPGSSFAYVAVSPTTKGKTIWLQRVTDAEYNSVDGNITSVDSTPEQQEIINISKAKWQWMADKKVDSLNSLFSDKSMFVHMGGSWGKTQELSVIKSGAIWYKKAEVYSELVNIIGNTAILLNDIDLVAVVGGNEVTNAFMVTEVYVKENGKWTMGSLTFSHLLRPVKLKK